MALQGNGNDPNVGHRLSVGVETGFIVPEIHPPDIAVRKHLARCTIFKSLAF
jgi:hypothetical protein